MSKLNENELSALRICAKLGHSTTPEVLLRLLGMVNPVPPAGDVEVLKFNRHPIQWALIDENYCAKQNSPAANAYLISDAKHDIKMLYAHVTSLADANRLFRVAHEDSRLHVIKIEAELTKALELNERNIQLLRQLEHAGLSDNWKARVSRAISDANPIAHNADESRGQDAEAAKGDDAHEGPWIVNGKEVSERPVCRVDGCSEFAESPWTNCREHWR